MKNLEILTLKKGNITDFSRERNILLNKAKSEWVFFLDSDEKMSSRLKKELSKLFSTSEVEQPRISGFYVKRRNFFLNKYSGTDRILRLGKRNSGSWKRKVHEYWDIKGSVGELKNPILHNTANTVSEMITKINFYSTLHAEANKMERKNSNIIKIIFYPHLKFIQSIFSGRGLVFSILQAFHSFLSWSKLQMIQSKNYK